MAQNKKFVYESIQDSQSIRDYIQSLMDGIEKGQIRLVSNGDEIVLNPGSLLNFEVKAKKKGEENKLSLCITWKNHAKKLSIYEDNNIEISV